MIEELYIENQLVELSPNSVSRTLQINDMGSVDDRQANYSNTIKIPRTAQNIAIFNMLGIAGNTTRMPYEYINVKYVVNGIEQISDGKGVINSTSTYYKVVVYDGNLSMSDLIGSDTLEELDFSDYNHNLTQNIFLNSFSNTDGYIYALGNFCEDFSSSSKVISITSPSFFAHTLFRMIFEQKGYSISGDIFDEADFKSRLISMNEGYDRTYTEATTEVYSRDNSDDDLVNDIFTEYQEEEYLIDSYTATDDVQHTITTDGTVTVSMATYLNIRVYINGARIENEQIAYSDNSVAGSHDIDYEFNVSASTGDVIEIRLALGTELLVEQYRINFLTSYTTTIEENDVYIPIAFEDLIGEESQIDFVKEMMQRFGLLFRKVRNEDTFEFITMQSLLQDNSNAEDWSDKYSSFSEESYLASSYAQSNLFKMVYDDSDSTETYADGEMVVDNVNLDEEKTLLTSIFKASETDDDGEYILNHWEEEEDDDDVITYEPNEDDLRIFKLLYENTNVGFKYSEDVNNSFTHSGDIPYLGGEEVYYQNEIDAYYPAFNDVLNNYKKVTLSLYLSIIDIYQLDFFKLKYLTS